MHTMKVVSFFLQFSTENYIHRSRCSYYNEAEHHSFCTITTTMLLFNFLFEKQGKKSKNTHNPMFYDYRESKGIPHLIQSLELTLCSVVFPTLPMFMQICTSCTEAGILGGDSQA